MGKLLRQKIISAEIDDGLNSLQRVNSENTIYVNAVMAKCDSSSSEEAMEISDDSLEGQDKVMPFMHYYQFADEHPDEEVEREECGQRGPTSHRGDYRSQQPEYRPKPNPTPDEITNEMIRRAEEAKTKIFPKPGKIPPFGNFEDREFDLSECRNRKSEGDFGGQVNFSAQMDEDYLVVGGHIDENTRIKIVRGDYVDFSKLLPCDKILTEEDGRMELIVKDGKTFWAHVSESISISNFSKWEQAYRIFANIYTSEFPSKSSELIQYNHIIHTISLAYVWENVYSYDKEFRLHMSKHPGRSWSVILQQAWSMKLKDRLYKSSEFNHASANNGSNYNSGNRSRNSTGSIKEPCRHFNRGKCKFGASCHFEHRCSYCNKFGHRFFNCRKAITDRERSTKRDTDRMSEGGKNNAKSN